MGGIADEKCFAFEEVGKRPAVEYLPITDSLCFPAENALVLHQP